MITIFSLLYIAMILMLMLGFIASPVILILGFLYGIAQGLTFTDIFKAVALALVGALVSGAITLPVVYKLFTSCTVPCSGSDLSEMGGLGYYVLSAPAGMILGGIIVLIMQIRHYKKKQDQLSAYYRSMYGKPKNPQFILPLHETPRNDNRAKLS